tara:strand:+ start:694 stop:1134 length:441 start_codon:yes stop_codon:yes gene_type:complete
VNINRLTKSIKKNEGFSNKIYLDQLGNPTIGFGHLITKKDKFVKGRIYEKKLLNNIFAEDLEKAIKIYKKIFREVCLKDEIEEVLIEMIFQLGYKNFSSFKKMIKAIKSENYKLAIREMKLSKWNKQTPKRVKILIEKVKKNGKKR